MEENKEKLEVTISVVMEKAPIWEKIKERFPNADERFTVVAYGNKIYAQDYLSAPLLKHEMVHCVRQGGDDEGASKWWSKYLTDNEFVKEEERIAYVEQIKEFNKENKDRNVRARFKRFIVRQFASDLYNNIVTQEEALKLLGEY